MEEEAGKLDRAQGHEGMKAGHEGRCLVTRYLARNEVDLPTIIVLPDHCLTAAPRHIAKPNAVA